MMEIVKSNNDFSKELLHEIVSWENSVDASEIASTLKSLLKAETKNAKWDVMDDNQVRLNALKLILQLNWIKTSQTNINIFNMIPPKWDKLNY